MIYLLLKVFQRRYVLTAESGFSPLGLPARSRVWPNGEKNHLEPSQSHSSPWINHHYKPRSENIIEAFAVLSTLWRPLSARQTVGSRELAARLAKSKAREREQY